MEGLLQTFPGVDDSVLRGEIDAGIYEQGGRTPTRIIRASQNWSVRVDWQMASDHALVVDDGCKWDVHVNLESMGTGTEASYHSILCTQNWIQANPANYHCEHTFAPSDMPALSADAHSGAVYRVVVSLVLLTAGGQPANMAGFVDLGLVHIYP